MDYGANNELRKLQFFGAGPKMPGYNPKSSSGEFDFTNGVHFFLSYIFFLLFVDDLVADYL